MSEAKTRGQKVNEDITALLKSRHVILWVVTRENVRVENALTEIAASINLQMRFYDCAQGVTKRNVDSGGFGVTEVLERNTDPAEALKFIGEAKERALFVMRNYHKFLDPLVIQGLQNLSQRLQVAPTSEGRALVILSPSGEVPPELSGYVTVIEYPIPDRAEIAQILTESLQSVQDPERRAKALPEDTREAAVDAAVGLAAEEAANCYARSLVTVKKIDPQMVSAEKKRVIAREKVLTWNDPNPQGLAAIGGYDQLKKWLVARQAAFSLKAREFGLPAPKGVFLLGVPGSGKSLTAKCIAAAWGVPLLRLDMGALRSKYVGESEGNIRKALQVAESVGNCVLWIDEIEKALAGSTGAQGDGGVAADALGTVLSWMQEHTSNTFVVATANSVENLPPELLRKGRFDELFFVDLPTTSERVEIAATTLQQFKRSSEGISLPAIAKATEGFTGAEIAALIPEALFVAFENNLRPLRTEDILRAAELTTPLSKTAGPQMDKLRQWAKGKTRPASTPEKDLTGNIRALDMD